MSKPQLIFVTGPSGAGKSATAHEIAASWHSTCALLNFDEIRAFVKAGYADPGTEWNEEGEKQWELGKEVVMAMARAYIRNGVSVVLDVFATPHDYQKWQGLFEKIPYKAFALMPELETVMSRNSQRDGSAKLKESDVTQNYDWSVGWKNTEDIIVLDNGSISIIDTAQKIIELSA